MRRDAIGVKSIVVGAAARVIASKPISLPMSALASADALAAGLSTVTTANLEFCGDTTSEKMGLAYYLDGRVSGIVGTHTHVQTADERIFPKGTAYISDIGMTGALNSMIGMKVESVLPHFLTQMPIRFTVETSGPAILTGAWIEVDTATGKALQIDRIKIIDEDIKMNGEAE